MEVKWSYLGLVPYSQTLELMRHLQKRIVQGDAWDYLLLLQHQPVITRGTSEKGQDAGLLLPRAEIQQQGIEIIDTDRGGKTTYHGPGQMVGYLVMDLKRRRLKIKQFVMEIMEIMRQVLDSYGIESTTDEKYPGLYVEGRKIGFCGFNVKSNITSHGFALNVNNELEPFNYLVPCGMPGMRITSMEELGGQRFSIFDVYWRFITCFAGHFGDEMEEVFIEDFESPV